MDTQLKKGIMQMCVLYCIKSKDVYGYELIKDILKLFPDVAEATVYSILRRLAAENYTSVYYNEMPNAPTRKYYKITPQGEDYLNEIVKQWSSIKNAVDVLMADENKEPII